MVVTSVGSHRRDLAWLRSTTSAHERSARCTDATAGLPMLGLMGPASRAAAGTSAAKTSPERRVPFGTTREIEIGYAIVRAARITYVGELGWELYIPPTRRCMSSSG